GKWDVSGPVICLPDPNKPQFGKISFVAQGNVSDMAYYIGSEPMSVNFCALAYQVV
ncbi:Hypothetical predicted protein, partial [Podarcis lilfordi]